MSAYTTFAKVKATMPAGAVLSETTVPSAADVTTMIADASAQVDVAFVMGGGTLPVALTETELLGMFDVRVRREVCYSVMTVRGGWDGSVTPHWAKWHTEFEELLKALKAGDISAIADSAASAPSSYTMDADPDSADPDKLNSDFPKSKVY